MLHGTFSFLSLITLAKTPIQTLSRLHLDSVDSNFFLSFVASFVALQYVYIDTYT
jgi:hypothetical protein